MPLNNKSAVKIILFLDRTFTLLLNNGDVLFLPILKIF